ncbi:MAG: tetratricopeptide repeat protein [Bryobacterales bacterium]
MPRLAGLLLLVAFPSPAAGGATEPVQSLYEAGEYTKAAAEAEAAVNPQAETVFYHGLALARLERYDEAQAVFEAGRNRYPRDKRFPLELAGVAYRKQQLARARWFLRRALHLDPADEYGNEFLGSLYVVEGDLAAALKYWNRIGKPLIQDVEVTPPPPIRLVLRERAITISGGQIFTLARLRSTEANLDRLDIFARRRIELTPGPGDRFNVTVRLLPAGSPLRGWLGRLLPVARGLPYQAIHFDRTNIASRAINFGSLWRWDANKRRIDLELAGPIRMNPRFRYQFGVDARDENWSLAETSEDADGTERDFKLKKVSVGGDFLFALTGKLEWTTGVQLTTRGFRNAADTALFSDSWSFEQRNQLSYRLLDIPERRIRVDSIARLRTGRVFTGATSRFGIVEGDLSGRWNPRAQNDAWEAHARLRAGQTFGEIPFDELFQLGMERDNDLWLRGHTGTRDGKKGSAPLGDDYALLQTGFDRTVARFRFLEVRAGPFFDTGRISGPSGFGSSGWLLDTGIAAKIVVAGGLSWSATYGRDLRGGSGVFYTSVAY